MGLRTACVHDNFIHDLSSAFSNDITLYFNVVNCTPSEGVQSMLSAESFISAEARRHRRHGEQA